MRTALPALLLLLPACATSRTVTQVDGLEVVTLRRDYTNVHVVGLPDGGLLLVDSGLERNEGALEEDLRAAGLDPARVRLVVLTHGHADHAGGAARLRQRSGAMVVAGAADAPQLAEGRNDTLCPTGPDARARLTADQEERFAGYAADVEVKAALPLGPLAGLEGEVRPLPGHTPGSLVVRVGRALFVGDLLRGALLGGGAEVHFYQCDLEENRAAVQRLLTEAPGARWFPGHFGPLEEGAVRATFGAPGRQGR
jgi:hydroxyacylglutathione hydrolase